VASIGLTETEARGQLGRDPLVLRHDYAESDRAPARGAEKWWTHRYLDPRGRRPLRPLLALPRAIDRPPG
jgi:hypothetical protein